MRVGIDARELQGRPTGIGRYLRNLLLAWPPGDDLILYFNGPPPADAVLRLARVLPRALADPALRGILWQEHLLPRAVREDRPDVFFSPAFFCPLRVRVPRVTTVHDLSFFSVPHDFSLREGARRRFLVRLGMRASTRVLANSDFTAREIAAYFPEIASRATTIPLGVERDLPPSPPRDDARRQLGVSGPFLLSVGSILNRRRLPVLLAAVGLARATFPRLQLDVVGDNRTSPRLDLPGLVHELGLEGSVRLSGFVSEADLAARYAAADGVAYLSEYEGFGLPALEALSRGLPLLTSRAPATGELFGSAALLAEPDDPLEIAAGLARMLGDAGLRRQLGEAGRVLAGRFSWDRAAEQTRRVLQEAAGQ